HHTRGQLNLVDERHLRDEVPGVPETTRGEPDLLLVVQGDAAAHQLVDVLRDGFLPYREGEFLRRCAGHGDHRHLAFPGFEDPALVRHLLPPPRAPARRVAPGPHRPEIGAGDYRHHHEPPQDAKHADPALQGRRYKSPATMPPSCGPRIFVTL